jgi:hypothetical protein
MYLLSGFNVPTKLAQRYAKCLGSRAQLRLLKSWAEALWPPEPYVRAQFGCLALGLWAKRWKHWQGTQHIIFCMCFPIE